MSEWMDNLRKKTDDEKTRIEEKRIRDQRTDNHFKSIITQAFDDLILAFGRDIPTANNKLAVGGRSFDLTYPTGYSNDGQFTVTYGLMGCEITHSRSEGVIVFEIKGRTRDAYKSHGSFTVGTDGITLTSSDGGKTDVAKLSQKVLENLYTLSEIS